MGFAILFKVSKGFPKGYPIEKKVEKYWSGGTICP
jgi:hypothetical protein